jgi:hypothetical protein
MSEMDSVFAKGSPFDLGAICEFGELDALTTQDAHLIQPLDGGLPALTNNISNTDTTYDFCEALSSLEEINGAEHFEPIGLEDLDSKLALSSSFHDSEADNVATNIWYIEQTGNKPTTLPRFYDAELFSTLRNKETEPLARVPNTTSKVRRPFV